LARIRIRNTPADDDGILLRRNEPARQIRRQQVHILLERFDVRFVHFLGEPAPQRVERPDIADPRLTLEQGVDVGNCVQRVRVIKRGAFRELDIDVEGVCAGQLDVEAVAGLHRPLPVRHLVRQPVSRQVTAHP